MKRLTILFLWAISLTIYAQNDVAYLNAAKLTAGASIEDSPLYGKIINVLGDSYVYNQKEPQSYTWFSQIAAKYNMTCRNYGQNGNGIVTPNATGTPMVERYADMDNDADYIVVVGGKNDYNKQIPIEDFKAGLRTLCNGLVAKYVGKKICFFTPWRIYPDSSKDPQNIKLIEYTDAMIEVCGDYSIPCYDSSRNSSIMMYNATFRANYCQAANDVSHLNQKGHLLFMNKAEQFLLGL